MTTKPKIFIATPMYGGVCHGSYMKSMMSLMITLAEKGYTATYNDLYNESLITRARNTLTEMFLRSDADYLLFIDADEGFSVAGVIKMIEEGKDLIGAAVPMKAINWDRVRKAVKEEKEDLDKYTAYYNVNINDPETIKSLRENPGKIIQVQHIGTGLLLISRKVFEDLKPLVNTYQSDQKSIGPILKGDKIHNFWQTVVDEESQRLLSEDYNFCKLWRSLGNEAYLAPYVIVSHMGTYLFK
jgi:hypothetical protein